MGKLEGKVAIVTGAGSGMGRAIAKLYAEEGAKVILADWNENNMNETLEEILSASGEAVAIKTDIAKEADVEAMMKKANDEFGGLDILANVAGISDDLTSLEDYTNELYERVMAVNINGPFYASRIAVRLFKEQEKAGTIINVSSIAGFLGARGGAAYTMSKHALIGLTRHIAAFYGHNNGKIRANAIAPGSIITAMTEKDPSRVDNYGMEVFKTVGPFNSGVPEDIAAAALFLASDESKFINGEVLTVDSAWTVR